MRGWTADTLPKGAAVSVPALPDALVEPAVRRGVRETVVQADVERLLSQCGCVVTVSNADMAFGPDGRPRRKLRPGWPDVTACGPLGRFIAVETKAGREGLRPAQREVLGRLWARGAVVCVPRTTAFAARVLYDAYAEYMGDPDVDRLLIVCKAYLRD